jgi:hypothetical protein
MVFLKSLLQRVWFPVLGQPLYGHNLRPIGLDGKHEARADRLSVEENRARAANPVLTPDVRPRKLQVLSQKIDQMLPGIDFPLNFTPIDLHSNATPVGHIIYPL